jgi:hypothetical protein
VPRAWITNELIPDYEDLFFVLLQFDPGSGTPVSAIFNMIADYAYEADVSMDDAWIERTLEGTTLLVDLVTHPVYIKRAGVDVSLFPERSKRNPEAIRFARVVCEVDPAEYAKAGEGTFVWTDPDGITLEEIRRRMLENEEEPLSFNVMS